LVTAIRLTAPPPKLLALVGGWGGYAVMYQMVLTSNRAATSALGRSWKRLHSLGIHRLWFMFPFSHPGRVFRPGTMIEGVIGNALALAALGLRLVAMSRVVPGSWRRAKT
jgi:DMSO/TMAO reductase YedYZ heme-binding membrane subunit